MNAKSWSLLIPMALFASLALADENPTTPGANKKNHILPETVPDAASSPLGPQPRATKTTASFTAEPKPVAIEKIDEILSKIPETNAEVSCEKEYYQQFASDHEGKPAGIGDTANSDGTSALKEFIDLRRSIPDSKAFKSIATEHPAVAREWNARLEHVSLKTSSRVGEGAFAPFVYPEGGLLDNQPKDLFGRPMKAILDGEKLTDRPTIFWNPGKSVPQSTAGKVFFLGHESQHLINWAPPEVVACLSNPLAAGARREIKAEDESPLQEEFGSLLNGFASALADEAPRSKAKDNREFMEDLQAAKTAKARCEKYSIRLELNFPRNFRDPKLPRPDISKGMQEILKGYLGDLKSDDVDGLDDSLEKPESPPKKEPNMDSQKGWGTENFVAFENCLKEDAPAALELFRLVKKYKVTGLDGSIFEDQMIETSADFYGVEFATHYIKTMLPKSEWKEAARSILKSMPPTRYPANAREVLDYVGSKKTNESRVFKTVLANPEFRELLGCKFTTQATPRYCGGAL